MASDSPHHPELPRGDRVPADVRLARARVDREVTKYLDQYGIEEIVDPLEAFAAIVSRSVAREKYFADRVADLRGEIRYRSEQGGTEQVRAEVILWERAQRESASLLATWVKLGLDERRVLVSEHQAEQMAAAWGTASAAFFDDLRAALREGNLDVEWLSRYQRTRAPAIMRSHLEAVASG